MQHIQEIERAWLQFKGNTVDFHAQQVVAHVGNQTHNQTCSRRYHFFVHTACYGADIEVVWLRNAVENIDDTRNRSDEA